LTHLISNFNFIGDTPLALGVPEIEPTIVLLAAQAVTTVLCFYSSCKENSVCWITKHEL